MIRVQDWHVPGRKKDKNGREKEMEDSEINVENSNMPGHFEIKKEVVLGLLKSIKVERIPGPNEVTNVIDEGRTVDVAYMHFNKALDKVLHDRLIQKTKMHGIHGDLAAWIQNWLVHRRQRVVVEGLFSGWRSVTCGVLQGSVLGRLLFVTYVNNLDENIDGRKFKGDVRGKFFTQRVLGIENMLPGILVEADGIGSCKTRWFDRDDPSGKSDSEDLLFSAVCLKSVKRGPTLWVELNRACAVIDKAYQMFTKLYFCMPMRSENQYPVKCITSLNALEEVV
eukprot:g36983.t1